MLLFSPFEGYEYDSRGTNTTSFTLNGTLVGAYTYDRSDPTLGKVTYTITNYLGTPVLSTDENGDIVESFLTDVFGNLYYRDARQDNAFHSKGYTSHTFDSESGLTYAHARYLDTSVHSFLSVDPIQYNLTKETLYDPQGLNGYVYGRNNPVLFTDPDGKWIHIAIGGLMGAVVGVAAIGTNDFLQGKMSTFGAYAGAAAGGAAFGAMTAATLGMNLAAGSGIALGVGIGAASGAVGNGTKQAIEIQQEDRESFSRSDFQTDVALSALTSLIPVPEIAGVTAGAGSYDAVEKQIMTKLRKGIIQNPSNITASTYLKMGTAGYVNNSSSMAVNSMRSTDYSSLLSELSRKLFSLSALISSQKKPK